MTRDEDLINTARKVDPGVLESTEVFGNKQTNLDQTRRWPTE